MLWEILPVLPFITKQKIEISSGKAETFGLLNYTTPYQSSKNYSLSNKLKAPYLIRDNTKAWSSIWNIKVHWSLVNILI